MPRDMVGAVVDTAGVNTTIYTNSSGASTLLLNINIVSTGEADDGDLILSYYDGANAFPFDIVTIGGTYIGAKTNVRRLYQNVVIPNGDSIQVKLPHGQEHVFTIVTTPA